MVTPGLNTLVALVRDNFTWLDGAALLWFAICSIGYAEVTNRAPTGSRNILNAIFEQRRRWMVTMAQRDVRVPDILILANFGQMTALFATTCVFILGGLAAVLLTGDAGRSAFQAMPLVGETTQIAWTAKLGVLAVLFISAFFKFIWAHRLNQYLGIAIGATPLCDDADAAGRDRQVRLATVLANRASINTYRGFHAFYFAVAALAWFFHAALFLLATTLVLGMLYRREYISRSARAIFEATTAAPPEDEKGPYV